MRVYNELYPRGIDMGPRIIARGNYPQESVVTAIPGNFIGSRHYGMSLRDIDAKMGELKLGKRALPQKNK